jgi:tRNA pseudouridine55 synthase
VHCSKGTYIRTLIDDLGEALGSGAYVSALRRIHVGPFDAAQMLTQERLVPFNDKQDWAGLDALLLPMDLALTGLPELKLTEEQQKRLVHGQTVLLSESELADLGMESADAIKLYGPAQQFIGVASLETGVLSVRRLLNTSAWQTPAL